jgi:methylenetetrahydrofolate reductase (NADPH)
MAQYFKLYKKLKAGADFVITQVGFDVRKFDELLRLMQQNGFRVPVLGNVYILNQPVAKVMNQKRVPGCVVTDDLYRIIEEEGKGPDRGRKARLYRAAKMVAILRGMGYDGVHLGGPHLTFEDIQWVIETSKEFDSKWEDYVDEFSFPQPGGFYLFEKDQSTGLNAERRTSLKSHPSKPLGYSLMRLFHHLAFTPEAPFYNLARRFYQKIEGTRLDGLLTELEYWIKFISSRCRRCGDCTLLEVAFLCPQSQCPKYLFNGQCGGSIEGWCEVFPYKKRCIYVRAYNRLKSYGEEETLKEGYTPPRNWDLDQTSSWANYFLGRDHHGQEGKAETHP